MSAVYYDRQANPPDMNRLYAGIFEITKRGFCVMHLTLAESAVMDRALRYKAMVALHGQQGGLYSVACIKDIARFGTPSASLALVIAEGYDFYSPNQRHRVDLVFASYPTTFDQRLLKI